MANGDDITGFKGTDAMAAKLSALKARMFAAAHDALMSAGQDIIDDAKTNYVPVDTGELRDTGHVTESGDDRLSITLSFGGGDTSPYAIAIHEHPSQFDPPSWKGAPHVTFHPSGRGPKYLELPIRKAVPELAKKIGEKIKGEL